jgi:hypothetical protein
MARFRNGIIHVHSTLSYDGRHSLEEIARFAKQRRYSFVAVTEHSDTFDRETMAHFVAACRRLSDRDLLLIPGLEFTCEQNLHLLGLGIEQFTDAQEPIAVARFITAQGGVAVVSHPIRYDYKLPSGLEMVIHGLEIWNVGYDGRFLPNPHSIRLWQRLREHNPALVAFGGQDLHCIRDQCHVKLTVRCGELQQNAIVAALKQGEFRISNPYLSLRARFPAGSIKLPCLTLTRHAYMQAKACRDRLVRSHLDTLP